jgi:biotin carboxyl carrier protein
VRYDIEVGGRTRQVAIVRTGATFAVTLDGQQHNVDVARVDGQTLSLILDSASSTDAVVVGDPASGQLVVTVNGTPVPVALDGRRRRRRDDRRTSDAGPQRIAAPMPGKVVRVLAKAGEEVAARQAVVVVEAMKMENELRAGRNGTVVEIHAHEGQSVDAGALLVVIR